MSIVGKLRDCEAMSDISAYDVTAHQTLNFKPDAMREYMALIAGTDSCLSGRPVEEVIHYEFRWLEYASDPLRLRGHGLARFADCVRFGDESGCQFALGLRTV
ncbi:MAG: hypothetical protein HY318_05740 [Armatimonadetes bacterium]|nr:hypothetical protein [Armatimonadota bacterium]